MYYDSNGLYYSTWGIDGLDFTIDKFERNDVRGSVEGYLMNQDDKTMIHISGNFNTIIYMPPY